jgi:hypothetical protein
MKVAKFIKGILEIFIKSLHLFLSLILPFVLNHPLKTLAVLLIIAVAFSPVINLFNTLASIFILLIAVPLLIAFIGPVFLHMVIVPFRNIFIRAEISKPISANKWPQHIRSEVISEAPKGPQLFISSVTLTNDKQRLTIYFKSGSSIELPNGFSIIETWPMPNDSVVIDHTVVAQRKGRIPLIFNNKTKSYLTSYNSNLAIKTAEYSMLPLFNLISFWMIGKDFLQSDIDDILLFKDMVDVEATVVDDPIVHPISGTNFVWLRVRLDNGEYLACKGAVLPWQRGHWSHLPLPVPNDKIRILGKLSKVTGVVNIYGIKSGNTPLLIKGY